MKSDRHFTTRRGFIAAASFGVVSLYGLWAGFGAAPLPFGGHGEHKDEPAEAGGHGGHGAAATSPTSEQFRQLTNEFITRFRQPDGSVRPTPPETRGDPHAGHAGHAATATSPAGDDAHGVEVFLMAFQWGFAPDVIRLAPNVLYHFHMMATDVSHGASIQLGSGSRIVRLRRGVLVEQAMTFKRPGEYLVYCTVYCGPPHDRMMGKIIVA